VGCGHWNGVQEDPEVVTLIRSTLPAMRGRFGAFRELMPICFGLVQIFRTRLDFASARGN
jgi:hypothetical protein